MNLIKIKIGQLLTGLAVVAIAFGANGFTESKIQTSQIWVNASTDGEYEELPDPNDYSSSACEPLSDHSCAFQRTDKPGTVPNTFDEALADQLMADGLIEPVDNETGVYVD